MVRTESFTKDHSIRLRTFQYNSKVWLKHKGLERLGFCISSLISTNPKASFVQINVKPGCRHTSLSTDNIVMHKTGKLFQRGLPVVATYSLQICIFRNHFYGLIRTNKKFNKVARYKINIEKSVVFYTPTMKHLKKEIF